MSNKENKVRETASKIPVPRRKTKNQHNPVQRNPLKTLNQNVENVPLARTSQGNIIKKLDTRFVPLSGTDEELDGNYEVFKYNLETKKDETLSIVNTENASGPSVGKCLNVTPSLEVATSGDSHKKVKGSFKRPSSKEETSSKSSAVCNIQDGNYEVFKYNLETKKDETLTVVDTENASGPSVGKCLNVTPSLEVATSGDSHKKVKGSFKRPSSKEETSSKSSAVCNIQETAISSKISDDWDEDYGADNFNCLLTTEKKIMGTSKIRKTSRSCVINWIVNVNGSLGSPAVIQLATWYLDSYLSGNWVNTNQLQVLAAACFWIACKVNGSPLTARRLVKHSFRQAFNVKQLVAAERSVLKQIKFNALPVVPYDFVSYLASSCDQTGSGIIQTAADFLWQCGILVDNMLNKEHASVVAAAAVLNALILLKHNSSSIEKLKACFVYKEAEKKAPNNRIHDTCAKLCDAVRLVSSVGFEYKAPLQLQRFSCPPHYIGSKIVRAVNTQKK